MFLPKGNHKKHYSTSGSYSQYTNCDYSKELKREKITKSYFPVYLGFFVMVRVRVATNRLTESEDFYLSVRVMVWVVITLLTERKVWEIDLGEVGNCNE